MVAIGRFMVPKVLLLLVGATVCLPIATAKDDHAKRMVELRPATLYGSTTLEMPSTMPGVGVGFASSTAYSSEQPLIAALDVVRLAPESVLFVPSQGMAIDSRDRGTEATQARPVERFGLQLPQPDRWNAVMATLALALFFFVRRLV